MKFCGRTTARIIVATTRFFRQLNRELARRGKSRADFGYLGLFDSGKENCPPLFLHLIGSGDGGKYADCSAGPQIKADLLFRRPRRQSSWRRRDHWSKESDAGAVRASRNNLILSFDGFSRGRDNEALMLYLAVQFGWLSLSEAIRVARNNRNESFGHLSGVKISRH
ncbi:MAG TPA: hypothetical protein P5328_02360 [Candidatus Paceibacterota bacterium]|nr:hypothetical protein [Candidatus Paceibacterota bacterium]HRZ34404.1 hypothetical protein [Candidatus Paceibacterota bacterium]